MPDLSRMPKSSGWALLMFSVAAIAVFWFVTIRAGTPWGDDWAMYVHHARNLASGRAYDDTGFIQNPRMPTYAPRTYPPGFPVMLVPFYVAFGINFTALKVPVIASFALALWAMAVYYRREMPWAATLLVVLGVGLSPVNWELKDYILPDFPFLLLVMLAAAMIDRCYTLGEGRARHGVLIGSCIYAAYATRTVGALFIPSLLAFDLLARRRITKQFILVAATFVSLAVFQLLVFPADSSYLKMLAHYKGMGLREILADVGGRAAQYRLAAADLWTMGHGWPAPRRIYSDLFFGLATAGLVTRMTARFSAVEVFVVGYVLTIFIFPGFQGVRFLAPLLPFALVYIVGLVDRLPRPAARWALLAALIGPLLCFYGSFYRSAEWARSPAGPQSPAARALFQYVRDHTPEDAVFVVGKPRAFSLYTDRRAATYHEPEDTSELVEYMRSIGARFVVTGIPDNAGFDERVGNDRVHFRDVYEIGGLGLFETRR